MMGGLWSQLHENLIPSTGVNSSKQTMEVKPATQAAAQNPFPMQCSSSTAITAAAREQHASLQSNHVPITRTRRHVHWMVAAVCVIISLLLGFSAVAAIRNVEGKVLPHSWQHKVGAGQHKGGTKSATGNPAGSRITDGGQHTHRLWEQVSSACAGSRPSQAVQLDG